MKPELVVVLCLWRRRGAAIVEKKEKTKHTQKKNFENMKHLYKLQAAAQSFPHLLLLLQVTFGISRLSAH